MFNFQEKIGAIFMIIICAVFCKTCAQDYMKGGDEKAIANYEKMLADKTVIEADLSDEYTERTIKVMKVPMTTYEFTYIFNLDGVFYQGKHSFDKLPTTKKIQVYYLKTDPHINSVDPAPSLKVEKEKNSSNSDLYWAIGFGLVGLFSFIGLFMKTEKTADDD